MKVVDNIAALRAAREHMGGSVGLVPTMGALHAGHIALVKQARAENEHVVASIFVNPSQFAQNEDLSKYPRDIPRDLAMLEAAGVDVVFTPTPDLIYPPNYQTWIEVETVSQGLEGDRRPGHFRGVATVVAKLFNLVQPQRAYFGQKDAQQVAVIKRMVRDLNFPLAIRVYPTVREADGLAMSSRNVYLSAEQRTAASVIRRALVSASKAYEAGERTAEDIRVVISEVIASEAVAELDYVSIVDAETLNVVEAITERPLLVSLVVKMGSTRLLDNMLLPAHLNTLEGLTQTLGGG
ncbi:MAG: pantoate--beta-alanine ligase [Chloroflexi bacterium]|nr:pantoate--beta-alanine ligase [Chloroflexota bacterium]MCC6896389.1 pantoate--beta-alanine ligase [Anaerolineae bacterium]